MMPSAAKDDAITRYLEWRDRCPIRTWRAQNRCSIRDLAAILDVSLGALQNWENGNSIPAEEITAKLVRITNDPDFAADYLDWAGSKPQP